MSFSHPSLSLLALLGCLLALVCECACASAPVLPLDARHGQYVLTPYVEYLEDASNQLTLDEVSSPAHTQDFHPISRGRGINFGYSHSTYWLRFTITAAPPTPEQWWLEIGYFSLEHIRLYAPAAPPVDTGLAHSFHERPIVHRYFVLPVRATAQARTFYLRIRSAGSLTIPLTLWQPAAFTAETANSYAIMFLYFGALLALMLFNLMLYFSLRDPSYLLYVLFAASMGAAQFALTGMGTQFLWSDLDRWRATASDFSFSTTGFFAVWFVRSFLDTRRLMPRVDWLVQIVWAVFGANMLFLALHYLPADAEPTGLGAKILSINSLPTCLLGIVAGVIALRHGREGARYFLIAWMTLMVGTVLAALRNFGWVPTNTLTTYMLQIGSALEMLLLSFALAERIRKERLSRELAQSAALAARQDLLETLAFNEHRLEERISERTRELSRANEQLRNSRQQLLKVARADALTGLANRLALDDHLSQAMAAADRNDASLAFLLLDLDRFKPVNDQYGHAAGDEILQEVARRLQARVRASDTVARIGGDEFVVLLDPLEDPGDVTRVAGKIIRALTDPFLIDGQELTVGTSVGVALYPGDTRNAKLLRQYADQAMYAAKQTGGSHYRLYRTIRAEPEPMME